MLVLERNKGMTNKVGQIEKETIIRRVLIVEHYLTVIDELYLLRKS